MNNEFELEIHNDMMNNINTQEENDIADLPILIEFNRENIKKIYNEVIKEYDAYSVKQYLKIAIYLIYMKDQEIFNRNKLEIIKRLKIMRKYIEHKVYNNSYEYNNKYRDVKKKDKKILKETLFKNRFITSERTKYNDYEMFINSLETRRIINETYREIKNIYKVEKEIEELTKENKLINISNVVEMIGMQNLKLNTMSSSPNNIIDLKYKMKESDNIYKNCINMLRLTEKIKNNYEKILYYKVNEDTREIKRNHCKNTILLNVDIMVNTLHNDIIKIIRSFVGETLIENIRILDIQKKYFDNPKETLKKMLYKWKREHLYNYIKSHYYMMYSLDNIMPNIFEYNREDYIEYYYFREIEELYYIDSLPLSNDINLNHHYINDVLNKNNIAEYYHFQKDIFIISKIITNEN